MHFEAVHAASRSRYPAGNNGAYHRPAEGGNGCISVTANVAPALCAEMQTACAKGNYTAAARIQERLMPLLESFIQCTIFRSRYPMRGLLWCR